ncbi:hypothetical protein ACFSJY_05370 [Thalassotalea euphylliae]|uniref:hypothetical protein n=1 Tax=Thalassotalea euphylliae TaxID=1655234 RepID=UPI00362E7BCA
MHKTLSQLIVITLMLLAFLSQAFAGANPMTCAPADNTATQHLSDSTNQPVKSQHIITDYSLDNIYDNEAECCDVDCCERDCVCFTSGCASIVYISTTPVSTQLNVARSLSAIVSTEHPITRITALYRPPIFTS